MEARMEYKIVASLFLQQLLCQCINSLKFTLCYIILIYNIFGKPVSPADMMIILVIMIFIYPQYFIAASTSFANYARNTCTVPDIIE
jgi:hypothetical protein